MRIWCLTAAVLVCAVAMGSPLLAAERYKLRTPGSLTARISNEVGIWKTEAAARRAKISLTVGNQMRSPDLECIVRPGASATLIERKKSTAHVQTRGCKGYVKSDYLSKD